MTMGILQWVIVLSLAYVIYYLINKYEKRVDELTRLIELNREEIKANREKIAKNAEAVAAHHEKIEANAEGVSKNRKILELNQEIIEKLK